MTRKSMIPVLHLGHRGLQASLVAGRQRAAAEQAGEQRVAMVQMAGGCSCLRCVGGRGCGACDAPATRQRHRLMPSFCTASMPHRLNQQ